MSQAVVHGNTVYLSGQVGESGGSVEEQAQEAFAQIEALLVQAGSSKGQILSAQIWLADIADFNAMNRVWDKWVEDIDPPVRATGEAKLASPNYKIEIIVIAAVVS